MGAGGQVGQMPRVEAGQIWVVEQAPAAAPCALDRAALADTNVLLYDRALAPLAERVLPVGAYAELLPGGAGLEDAAIFRRALEFAAEGWSVVQLVEARSLQRERLQLVVRGLIRKIGSRDLPVLLIAKTAADGYRGWNASLRRLPELIDEVDEAELLTIVFGPFGVGCPAHTSSFNGLAG